MFSWGHEAGYCGEAIYKYKNNKIKELPELTSMLVDIQKQKDLIKGLQKGEAKI